MVERALVGGRHRWSASVVLVVVSECVIILVDVKCRAREVACKTLSPLMFWRDLLQPNQISPRFKIFPRLDFLGYW